MTNKEAELIELIRCHNTPEIALEIAIGIILGFLKQHGSSEVQAADSLRELA